MKLFKNILVVFNNQTDNQVLLEKVVDLAKTNQARLTVIDIIEETPGALLKPKRDVQNNNAKIPGIRIIEDYPEENSKPVAFFSKKADWENFDNSPDESTFNIQEYIFQEEQSEFQHFYSSIQDAGITVIPKIVHGIPFIEIIREVLRNNHDLVIINADGGDGLKESIFGTTTLHLMRKCPCPVWIIKPEQNRRINRILSAIDLAQDDEDRTKLARKILELSYELAKSGQSEIIILHAWTLFGESRLKGRLQISEEDLDRLAKETHDAHRRMLIDLLRQFAVENLKPQVYLLKGDAADLIYKLTQTKFIDLIVMGTVSRGGIAGLLIGNTAEKIIRKVNCSLITIKPDGFITPVKLD